MSTRTKYDYPNESFPVDFYLIKSDYIKQWAIVAFEESYEVTELIIIQDNSVIKKASLASMLLYFALKIAPELQLSIETGTKFINEIRDGLSSAIEIELQLEILENYDTVEDFIKEKIIYFIDEFEYIMSNKDIEYWDDICPNSKFRNLSFMVLAQPLDDFYFERDKNEIEEFHDYMVRMDFYDSIAEKCQKFAKNNKIFLKTNQASDFFDSYLKEYKNQYGEIKFSEVKHKIYSADRINKSLVALINNAPHESEIIPLILSIQYFMLAKKTTVALGCILFLEFWQISFNKQFRILGEREVESLFNTTLSKALKLL